MLDAPIVHHLRELHKDESITLEKKLNLMNITLIHYPFQVHMAEGIGSKLIEAAEIYATEKKHEKSHYLLI